MTSGQLHNLEDIIQIPQMQQSFFSLHSVTDKIAYLLTALLSLDPTTLLLFQKTWFTQQLFDVEDGEKTDLSVLLHKFETLSSQMDSVVFDSLAECYNQSPAGTIQTLKRSGLRPGKIKDFIDALSAASLAPQLRDDVQSDRLTMGDVADLGHSTTRIRKDDLTRSQQRKLITEGRKPLLNFRSTEPTKCLRSAHARKAVSSAVRENCPDNVKPPRAPKPKPLFGVRMSASGSSLTLTAPPFLLDKVRSELSSEKPHYLNLLRTSTPLTDDQPGVDLKVLLGTSAPDGVYRGKTSQSDHNQAEGISLLHALVIGVQHLTGREWTENSVVAPSTGTKGSTANQQSSKAPRKQQRPPEEPLTAQAVSYRTKRKLEKTLEGLDCPSEGEPSFNRTSRTKRRKRTKPRRRR